MIVGVRRSDLMRFCIVGPAYPLRGGIAHYTAMLTLQMRQAGHEAMLYAFAKGYAGWLYPGRTDQDPSQRPLHVPPHALVNPWSPRSWLQTARQIITEKPDALIIQWWVPYWSPMQITLARQVRRAGIPVFMDCQNVLPHDTHPFGRLLTALTLRTANACMVYSAAHQQELLELAPAMPNALLPFPAYGRLAQPASPLPTVARLPTALFFGFVRPYKGLPVLLHAMAEVLPLVPFYLLIVGEFWQGRAATDRLIEQLNLQAHVTIVDHYVPDEEIGGYFAAADVLVLPYMSHVQSGVMALAQAFHKPVIASRVGGLIELIREGETGLLVEPNDPHALSLALQRFFRDNLGAAMVPHLQAFSAEKSWEQVVTAWQTLTEQA